MPRLEHGFGIDPETAGSINGISRAIAFGEKNKEIGRVYQKYGNKEWCILSKNLKCNRGRMEIKRIIGVMANKELRKKYFGF